MRSGSVGNGGLANGGVPVGYGQHLANHQGRAAPSVLQDLREIVSALVIERAEAQSSGIRSCTALSVEAGLDHRHFGVFRHVQLWLRGRRKAGLKSVLTCEPP